MGWGGCLIHDYIQGAGGSNRGETKVRQNLHSDSNGRWGKKKNIIQGRLRYEISAFKEVESALEKQGRANLLSFHKGTEGGFIKEVVLEVAHWLIFWKVLFIQQT